MLPLGHCTPKDLGSFIYGRSEGQEALSMGSSSSSAPLSND
jgi:hypothetical protein